MPSHFDEKKTKKQPIGIHFLFPYAAIGYGAVQHVIPNYVNFKPCQNLPIIIIAVFAMFRAELHMLTAHGLHTQCYLRSLLLL